MLIINLILLILFLLLYVLSFRHKVDWAEIDQKEHKLYFLYSLSDLILTRTGLYKRLSSKKSITDSLKAIHITNKSENILKLYWCSKLSLVVMILVIFQVLSIFGQIQSKSNTKIEEGKYLKRPTYGEGSDVVELYVALEDTEEVRSEGKKPKIQIEDIKIMIKERGYTRDELDNAFENATNYLKVAVLGNNRSPDYITDNLKFIKVIPGTSITVDWKIDDISLIHSDGRINNEDIPPEGKETKVKAILIYQQEQLLLEMKFKIMPREYTTEATLLKKLEQEIDNYSVKTEQENRMELPVKIDGYRLIWEEKKKNIGVTMLIMGLFTAILSWFYGDRAMAREMSRRKEQMLIDYPEIINKFTLLVNAGMTAKQAWNRITEDYYQVKKLKNIMRYAYEEMKVTAHEISLGVPEGSAYEQFGRRAGLIPYMKFGSLISQNIKKGNKGLLELLSKESMEAFEERKETAKRLGEEAGTKLLVPMMIMLIIVFLIILIPAFQSMGM